MRTKRLFSFVFEHPALAEVFILVCLGSTTPPALSMSVISPANSAPPQLPGALHTVAARSEFEQPPALKLQHFAGEVAR